jgi:hypothetical protein
MSDEADGALRAELLASAVVTAHNHVLRRWLRNETGSPREEFEQAIDIALASFGQQGEGAETTVVVLRTPANIDAVLPRLRRALTHDPGGAVDP